MATEAAPTDNEHEIVVDLREPVWAVLLAWFWPGLGHIYQRRYAKGILFMVCVLGTFFCGLSLGRGHVVYASWKKNDYRWQYACQIWVGAPALPAFVQSMRVNAGREPLAGGIMAPPRNVDPDDDDELAGWYKDLGPGFELGTLYTVVAGLLNILAMYDAYAGPAGSTPEGEADKPPPDEKKKKKKGKGE